MSINLSIRAPMAIINAPIEKIDITAWFFSLPEREYQGCSAIARGCRCDAARATDIAAIKNAATEAWSKQESICSGNSNFRSSPPLI
jgi:hypothetical protein